MAENAAEGITMDNTITAQTRWVCEHDAGQSFCIEVERRAEDLAC